MGNLRALLAMFFFLPLVRAPEGLQIVSRV